MALRATVCALLLLVAPAAQAQQLGAGLGQALLNSLSQTAVQNAQSWLINSLQKMDAAGAQLSAVQVASSIVQAAVGGAPLAAASRSATTQQTEAATVEDVAQQVKRLGKEALFAYDSAANTVEATVGRVKSQFCTEPEMRVGQRVPAVLKGPEMNITVSLGNCSLTHDGHGKAVACTHPSVSFVKTPITYVSKHQEADVFLAPECVIGTSHGEEPEEIVLYDGGEDVVYTSVQDFVNDMADGVFGLDLTAPDLGIEWVARLREQMALQLQAQQDALAAQQAAAAAAMSKAAAGGGSGGAAGQQVQPSAGQVTAGQDVPGEHRVVTQVLPGGWKVVTRTSSSPSSAGLP